MKAILHTQYGPPDELQLKEVAKPVPGDNDVLIKIHTSTVTSSDCNIRNFTFVPSIFKLPSRLQFGYNKPKKNILGLDVAGEIKATGENVKRFKIGDQVFGSSEPLLGAHAEYVCLPENSVIAAKPANMTYEEAACLPLAANVALYFIRDQGNIEKGQKVLINGASGAIGTFSIQLAKYYGADVTGVCSTKNIELVESLGADKVIDYTKENFTDNGETYDVILDAVSKSSFSECKNSLTKNGVYLATLPTLAVLFQAVWTFSFGGKRVKNGDAKSKLSNLVFLKELAEAGKLKSVIDKGYPLEKTAEAFAYVEQGHKRGNVVISVS